MSQPENDIESFLVDLEEISLLEIESRDAGELESSVRVILQQVDRPRKNAGTSQPGRVD